MKKYLPLLQQVNKKYIIIGGGIVVCIIAIIIATSLSSHNKQSAESPTPTPTPPPHVFIDAVQKQIPLPKNEEPMIATVDDKTKLQEQEFFQQAENGDKVLMYKQAKKAFLYRPSTDTVIAEAPLEYDDPNASASAAGNGTVLYESH